MSLSLKSLSRGWNCFTSVQKKVKQQTAWRTSAWIGSKAYTNYSERSMDPFPNTVESSEPPEKTSASAHRSQFSSHVCAHIILAQTSSCIHGSSQNKQENRFWQKNQLFPISVPFFPTYVGKQSNLHVQHAAWSIHARNRAGGGGGGGHSSIIFS